MRRDPIEGNWLHILNSNVKQNWSGGTNGRLVYNDNRDKNSGDKTNNGLTNWQKRVMAAQYGK